MTYVLAIEGLDDLTDFDNLKPAILTAATRAINAAASRGAAAGRRNILKEIAFRASYLTGLDSSGDQRLGIKSKATRTDLSATISAQSRPTMLARFVSGGKLPAGQKAVSAQGLKLEVRPGRSSVIGRAILIRLNNNNVGLAVRTSGGRPPLNAYAPKKLADNLYLLYGPSVAQAFLSTRGEGVAVDITPETLDYLSDEFFRQMDLTNNG